MKKRVISVICIVVIAFSLSVSAIATNYTDLDGHWSKEYIEDLAERGYLSGYSDNTMRPEKNMTACETLVLLSRFYELTDGESELIRSDYEDVVVEEVTSTLSWAFENIAVCLAAGIITETELTDIDLSADIEKEKLAVFMIRAMQLTSEAEALANMTLIFNDASEISEDCRGSVAKLYQLGIVKGDDANNFLPQSNVTRAVVATMVSRALDHLEENNKTLLIENYSGVLRVKGIIDSVSGNAVDICGFDGLTREYTLTDGVAVTVDGDAKAMSVLYEGCYAQVTIKNGAVAKVAIDKDADVVWVQGAVNSLTTKYIYVTNLEAYVVTRYAIPTSAEVIEDGVSISASAVTRGNFITLKIENDDVTEVYSSTCDVDVTGTITEIRYDTTVKLRVTDDDGTVFRFMLNISDLPTIERDDTIISIDRLKTGNAVTVTIEDCEVTSIIAVGSADTITGELISITTNKNGTVWVVKDDDGNESSLTLDESAGVYSGSKAILLSDIQVGDDVTVVVYDNTITEIYLQNSASTSAKITGKVLDVDAYKKQIMILTSSDKLLYVNTSSVISMISADTGKAISLTSIQVDSQLVAYGAYTNSTNFTAISIIIE